MALAKKDIGNIGEFIAAKYLEDHGYSIVRYGKEMHRTDPPPHLLVSAETCPDNGCNYPWQDEFSKSSEDELRRQCREKLPYGQGFLYINFAVNEYIQRFWWHHSENNPLPHHWKKIRERQLIGDKDGAESMKNENRAALKNFPGGDSFPGRYDFICYKDGVHRAIEVKVNTSRISYWQSIRLGLICKFGGSTNVLRVTAEKETLERCLYNQDFRDFQVDWGPTCLPDSIKLPSDNEFLEIVRFIAIHEQPENLRKE